MHLDRLVAHRGHLARHPENTRAALLDALRLGARWIELDVQLSRDGVPFVFHDRELQRLCGVSGAVHRLDAAQLDSLRVGAGLLRAGADTAHSATQPERGTDALRSATSHARSGTDPLPAVTDAFRAGTDPQHAGTDALSAGTDPLRSGTGPARTQASPLHTQSEPLMHLSELPALLQAYPDTHAFVEIKRVALEQHGMERVSTAVERCLLPIAARCTWISFALDYLLYLRTRSPRSIGAVIEHWEQREDPRLRALAPEFLFCDLDGLPPAGALTHPGSRIAIYEVDRAETARALFARGVDLVETFQFEKLAGDLGA